MASTPTLLTCNRCYTMRRNDPSFPACDMHLGSPCYNCRVAPTQPCCQRHGPSMLGATANDAGPVTYPSTPAYAPAINGVNAAAATRPQASTWAQGTHSPPPGPAANGNGAPLRRTNPTRPRVSTAVTASAVSGGGAAPSPQGPSQTRNTTNSVSIAAANSGGAPSQAGPPLPRTSYAVNTSVNNGGGAPPRSSNQAPGTSTAPGLTGGRPSALATNPPPRPQASSTAPTASAQGQPTATASRLVASGASTTRQTTARAEEAERERARLRTEMRRTKEQQDTILDLQARLDLEKRARGAAEERAKLAYEQGHHDGVFLGEVKARAKYSALQSGVLPYSVLQQMQSLPLTYPVGHGVHDAQTAGDTALDAPQASFGGLPLLGQRSPAPSPRSSETQHTETNGANVHTSRTSPLASSAFGSRVDSAADPRLQELREKAIASTQAFRERDSEALGTKAANDWLAQNSDILEVGATTTGTNAASSVKRKREEVEEGEVVEAVAAPESGHANGRTD